MTQDELNKLKESILAPKKVATDSGTVEERTVDELRKGVDLIEKKESEVNSAGAVRPRLSRLGLYRRINL